jgi:hypothetical protein
LVARHIDVVEPSKRNIRVASHTRLRARDHYTSCTLIGGEGGAGSSLLHTMLEGPTECTSECKMDVKSTWIPTWHPMDDVFMVTWIIFKNHLLEVGLTQNQETMALRTLTTINLFYFIMCEELHEEQFIEIACG